MNDKNKKPASKQGNKEVQLDIDPSTKIEALEEKINSQDGVILALRELLEEKDARIIQLSNVIDVQSEDLDKLPTLESSVSICGQDIRTTMLLSLVPIIGDKGFEYAQTNAQSAEIAVDKMMKVWGFSDEVNT
jgi:hypothetical protein